MHLETLYAPKLVGSQPLRANGSLLPNPSHAIQLSVQRYIALRLQQRSYISQESATAAARIRCTARGRAKPTDV